MITRSFFICVSILMHAVYGFSQTGELKGLLFDQTTKEGFAAVATVWFPGLKKGTLSDNKGSFFIEEVPTGTHQLKIECIGYRDTVMQVEIQPCRTTALIVNFPIGCHFRSHKGNKCPYCHKSDKAIPIVYGLPSKRMMMLAEKNKMKLAGCQITGCDPKWYCTRDEKEF